MNSMTSIKYNLFLIYINMHIRCALRTMYDIKKSSMKFTLFNYRKRKFNLYVLYNFSNKKYALIKMNFYVSEYKTCYT